MSALFLTSDEIKELTGTRIKSKQLEVLRQNSIGFVKNANGSPVVVREALVQSQSGTSQQKPRAAAPNLRAV